MNKHDALIVLIKETSVFTDNQKMRILSAISTLNDDQINTLGTFLAMDQVESRKIAKEMVEKLDVIEHSLTDSQPQVDSSNH